MPQFKQMDPNVTIQQQLGDTESGPVVLMNVFTVAPEDVDQMLAAWKEDANYFRRQPGLLSAQLHRGIAGSSTFFNYAVWESVEKFRAAFSNPEFQDKLRAYPDSATASPHLFRKLAVENICST